MGAFLVWGLSPLFWKLLVRVPASQLLAHRILWAAAILIAVLVVRRRLPELRAVVTNGRAMAALALTTILISGNWLTYIWAVLTDRVLQASLGYYINPLVTVLLGMVFLGERLTRPQWVSAAMALAGVAVMIWDDGTVPWIALALALSFGFYSLIRKRVQAEAVTGLCVETLLLAPLVGFYLVRTELEGSGAFGHSGVFITGLLCLSGLVTALPLILFTYGARRLPLTSIGFLQYSAPTLQFLLAVFLFEEPFTVAHLTAFLLIWIGLALFTYDLHRRMRRKDSAVPSLPAASATNTESL